VSATLTADDPRTGEARHRGRRAIDRPAVRDRLDPPMPDDGRWGWGGPLLVAAVAAVLRFVGLGSPHVFSFDETYYAKDALSLLRYGYERETVNNANDLILAGHSQVFTGNASYVVHPPIGKWVIALGEWMFGVTPFGWRFMPAVVGTLVVLMLARIVRRMTRSTLLGCMAGLLLALDGLSIVLSRSALLDGTLAFFVLAAFGALVVDRDRMRSRLAEWYDARPDGPAEYGAAAEHGTAAEYGAAAEHGPKMGLRPWRLLAGLMLGLACATKWSGIYFIVAFGLMTVLWDLGARKTAGIRSPYVATLRRDVWGAFLSIVPVTFVVYAVAWIPWLLTFSHQKRTWYLGRRGPTFLPDNVRALLDYHAQMWHFHLNLDSPHPYAGKAIGWLIQVRPTAFWSIQLKYGQQGCPASSCTREVTSLGTPLLWWAASAALVWLLWRWVGARDWRAGAVLGAVMAGWLPWVILYNHRTIFTFYEVAFAPFVVMALTFALGTILGRRTASPTRRTWGAASVGGYLLLVIANTAWIWPLLVGTVLSQDDWLRRMWFRGWI
jgi:dolichyl-phosphate-mannose--protein O-mannosyl transferase